MTWSTLNRQLIKLIPFFLLILISGVAYRFLLTQSQLFTSDDYDLHAARSANYYLALKQHQFLPLPRFAPNLNGSFGYPVFNYIYPLPYLTISLIHTLGFSIQQSLLLSIFLILNLGGLGAYLFTRRHHISFLSSLLLSSNFIINPYTLLLVYWRGALGEIFLYSLVPWILLFIQQIFLDRKRLLWQKLDLIFLSLSLALAIMSHLPSMLFVFMLSAVWILVLKLKTNYLPFWSLLAAFILGLSLSSFYLLPAVLETNLINYQASNSLVKYSDHFIKLTDLFQVWRTIKSNQFFPAVLQIGLTGLSIIILSLTRLILQLTKLLSPKINGKSLGLLVNWDLLIWSLTLILTLFLITPGSKFFWDHLVFLQAQQYPWRLLWVVNVICLFLGLEIFSWLKSQPKLKNTFFLILTSGFLFSLFTYAHPKGYFSRSDFDWYESVITGSSFDEHRPKKALPSADYTVPGVVFFDATKSAQVNFLIQTGTNLRYQIHLNEPATLIHKRVDFPGWQATIDHQLATINPSSNQNSSNSTLSAAQFPGLIALDIPAGDHEIDLSFSGSTPIRTIANFISLGGWIIISIILLLRLNQKSLYKHQ